MVLMSVAVTLVSLASVASAAAGPVPTDPVLPGLTYANVMLGDDAVGKVFAGGAGGLAVAPADGSTAPAVVPGAPADVTALATTADGATLWVGGQDGTVRAFDAADPSTGSLAISPSTTPFACIGALAVGGDGRVWAVSGECGAEVDLAVLDPKTDTWTAGLATTLFNRKLVYPVAMAIDSTHGTTLAVGEDGYTRRKALIATVDVSDVAPSVISTTSDDAGPSQLAVTPDGSRVIVARGQRDAMTYSAADLANVSARRVFDSHGITYTPDSSYLALSGDGTHLGVTGIHGTASFGPVASSNAWLRLCSPGFWYHLTWVGQTLFGAYTDGQSVQLRRCDDAAVAQSLITATTNAESRPGVGQAFKAVVHLAYHADPVADARITVSRSDSAGVFYF